MTCVAWSPDGRSVLTGNQDETARIWDAETGRQKALLNGHSHGA
jgi:WD40 repeat protein